MQIPRLAPDLEGTVILNYPEGRTGEDGVGHNEVMQILWWYLGIKEHVCENGAYILVGQCKDLLICQLKFFSLSDQYFVVLEHLETG